MCLSAAPQGGNSFQMLSEMLMLLDVLNQSAKLNRCEVDWFLFDV